MYLALVGVALAPFDCMASGAGTSYMRSSPDTACVFWSNDEEEYWENIAGKQRWENIPNPKIHNRRTNYSFWVLARESGPSPSLFLFY